MSAPLTCRRFVQILLCLSLIVAIGEPTVIPSAEGASAASIQKQIRKVGKQQKKAKKIKNNARKRAKLKRLAKKLRKLRKQLAAASVTPVVSPFPMAMVTIGNPGNAADSTGYGAVADVFQIGTFEVTLDEYAAFLNAVARTDDNSLYSGAMNTNLNSRGISRTGTTGSYVYKVEGSGKRPVTYVSWFDAARFCNWLHNGRPSGLQDATTTERGAYTLDGATSGSSIPRNPGASYWIPTDDEWYKAAYYDPRDEAAGGPPGDDNYWEYPTMSDTAPDNMIGPMANQANIRTTDNRLSVTQSTSYSSTQNYLTDVGAFSGSPSYYGTFDQGGNLLEMTDTVFETGPNLIFRGASWSDYETGASASFRSDAGPDLEGAITGFRIASPASP